MIALKLLSVEAGVASLMAIMTAAGITCHLSKILFVISTKRASLTYPRGNRQEWRL